MRGQQRDREMQQMNGSNIAAPLAARLGRACALAGLCAGLALAADAGAMAPAFEVSGSAVDSRTQASAAKSSKAPRLVHQSLAKGTLTTPFEGVVVVAGGAVHQDDNADGLLDTGEQVQYHYTVVNTGDLPLTALVVSDGAGTVACPQSALAPGEHMACTRSHAVTAQEQVDGVVINTVMVAGQDSNGRPVQASDGMTTRNLAGRSGVRGFKSPRLLNDLDASASMTLGDVVRYTFVVKNDNADALTAILLSEPDPDRIDGSIGCSATTLGGQPFAGNGSGALAGWDSVLCFADYTVRATDVAAGEVLNLAEVRATAPGPRTLFASAASLIVVPPAEITLDKRIVSGNPYAAVGDVIGYDYVVRNAGGVSLPGPVQVVDDRTTVTCPDLATVGDGDALFDVGEEITCTATYTVVQDDLEVGNVVNIAIAYAGPAESDPDNATAVFVGAPPRIGVSKRARSVSGHPPFTVIFDMEVANYGPVSLSDVQVTENLRETFPLPVAFSVVSVTTDGSAVPNPAFDGVTDIGLLLPAQSTLAVGGSFSIRLQLQVEPQGQTGPFLNQVVASGTTATNVTVTDISTNGVNPDPNGDGVPDELTPTLVSFPFDPLNIPAGSPWSLLLLATLATLLGGAALRRR